MKGPLRSDGSIFSTSISRKKDRGQDSVCEIVAQFDNVLLNILGATNLKSAEHTAAIYKDQGLWNVTPFETGKEMSVSLSRQRNIINEHVPESSTEIYTIHTHPIPRANPPSFNLSYSDVGSLVDNDYESLYPGDPAVTMVKQISPDKCVIQSLEKVEDFSDAKKQQYDDVSAEIYNEMAQGNPNLLYELFDFMEPEYKHCDTVVEFDQDIRLSNLDMVDIVFE